MNNRLHFIGFVPQSDGVSVPMYAPMSEYPTCECGENVCPEECLCRCHYVVAVKTVIKEVLKSTLKMVSVSELLAALRVAGIALPDNSSEAWQFVADMRFDADRELVREREAGR